MNFKGKTAIVTGATRGIGKAICDVLLAGECTVIATGRKIDRKKLKDRKNLKYIALDFLDSQKTHSFLRMAEGLKQLDILVNNAGINVIEPIGELNKESWDKIMQVNLTGPMLLTKAVSPCMKKRKKGRVLNISSIWGVISKEKRDAYSASKTGLLGLTKASALDLAPYHVLVNALCPGFTMTDLTRSNLSKSEIESLSRQIPTKRFAQVDEIAQTAAFLCSDLNTYMTGQTIVVDGGFTTQ